MLFNSIEFAFFLPVVLFLHWSLRSRSIWVRNAFLVIVSFVFYGWWDPRFLSLILLSAGVDFLVGRSMEGASSRQRKVLLGTSLVVNLGVLCLFKYSGFFLESLAEAFTFLGAPLDLPSLSIVLPVGISFYTFQTMSYTIDVYRGRLEAEKDPIAFLAFVSFFPQLVAGPIERAANLLPQFKTRRTIDVAEATDALRQLLWGIFKKVAVADQAARYVDLVFDGGTAFTGWPLFLGALLFSIQIYGDFSGYSDIAIGTARLFGFRLMKNFDLPYFSRDIAEFWRRWHISLSTWFRDYLYIPLGGSRGSRSERVRNVFIIFLVSGLWHGPNWTFVAWGGIHATLFLPLLLTGSNRKHVGALPRSLGAPRSGPMLSWAWTMILVTLAWVFFRSPDMKHAVAYLARMFDQAGSPGLPIVPVPLMLTAPLMFVVEWTTRAREHPLAIADRPAAIRWSTYFTLTFLTLFLFDDRSTFIYFQF